MDPYREQAIEAYVDERVDARLKAVKKELQRAEDARSAEALHWRVGVGVAFFVLVIAGSALARSIHENECNVRIEREKTERVHLENLKKEHDEAKAKWEHESCVKEYPVFVPVHDSEMNKDLKDGLKGGR